MNLKWHQLKEFIETLSNEVLKCDVLISNPSEKLHVCTGVRRTGKGEVFSQNTVYLTAGKKVCRYWIRENPKNKTVFLFRGYNGPEEQKTLHVKEDIWIEESKDWTELKPIVKDILIQQLKLEEISEKTSRQFLGLIGTSW